MATGYPTFREGMKPRDFKAHELQRVSDAAKRFDNMHVAAPLYLRNTPSGVRLGIHEKPRGGSGKAEVPPTANIIQCIIAEVPAPTDVFLTIREVERGPTSSTAPFGTLVFVGDPIPRVRAPYPYFPLNYVYQVPYAGLEAGNGGPWFHAYSFGEEGEEEWHLLGPPARIELPRLVRIHRDETRPSDSRVVPFQYLIFNPQDGNKAILSTPSNGPAHPGYRYGNYSTSGDPRPPGSGVLLSDASSRLFRRLIDVQSAALGGDLSFIPRPYDWQFRASSYLERP